MIAALVFLPLLGALISGLFVRQISVRGAQIITAGFMLVSAILAGFVFHDVAILGNVQKLVMVEWLKSGDFHVDWILRVDVLTAVMLIVVTWVSTVVHFYAVGYMDHDPHPQRFMSYLSLFTFFMLMLVTADNFIQLFLGWEGVGLCSYLLIGFWYKKDEANAAAMKAFLVNRVGDFGFALGVFAVFVVFGTVSFDEVFRQVPDLTEKQFTFLGTDFHALTLIGILLFIGCMGKSAQLGLHTWLPDAMEGPTPVSALIHAATMVTAGVFLVARCSPIYEYAPVALNVIAVVGGLTALFAATIGLVQNDIKKVIAYSTCSQLGYMFFACGVGAYSAAIFHLMTHAFLKALLFLGAGSVIHAMSGEQDMRKMGGIWKLIPVTYGFAWVGSLALAGIPPFAGFFSKDIILESAFAAHTGFGNFAFTMGIMAAFLTAFYSWRLLFMTFHGKPRASHEVMHHVHESPKIMTLPLIVLVAGAIFSGLLGVYWLDMVGAEGDFWRGAIFTRADNEVLHHAHHVPLWVKLLPLVMGVSGIALAWVFYIKKPEMPGKVASAFRPVYTLFLNRWYFDEIYHAVFVRGAMALGKHSWKVWDTMFIDGLGPNGFARLSQKIAQRTSALQTGYAYHYAFAMVAGVLLLVSWVFVSFN